MTRDLVFVPDLIVIAALMAADTRLSLAWQGLAEMPYRSLDRP